MCSSVCNSQAPAALYSLCFFFSSRRRHTRLQGDWSSDVCSSDLAYLTGMNPLSFVAFFTIGELGMMMVLALRTTGGAVALWHELVNAKAVLFWQIGRASCRERV